MKKIILLLPVIFITITAFCQFSAALDKNASVARGRHSIAIGNNAIAATDSVIIIGDFDVPYIRFPAPLTVHYDCNFWYFKTPKGKSLLRYLDTQTKKKRTGSRFMIIYNHILKYYMEDIAKRYKSK